MDDQLRKLERKYQESGTSKAAEDYLNARLRAGHTPPMRYLMEAIIRASGFNEEITPKHLLEFLEGKLPILGQHDGPSWTNYYVMEDRVDNLGYRLDNLENQL